MASRGGDANRERAASATCIGFAGEFVPEVCCPIIRRSPLLTPNVAVNMPIAVFLPARPDSSVDALAFDVQAGAGEPLHVHPREALLIYAEAGAFNLFTEDRVWALLPSRAIWLPPGVPSGWQAGMRSPVRLRPLHFPLPLPANVPTETKVIGVSALLAAVIDELPPHHHPCQSHPRRPGQSVRFLRERAAKRSHAHVSRGRTGGQRPLDG